MKGRKARRMVGVLRARLPELQFRRVADPRRRASTNWKLSEILSSATVGMVAGCRSLRALEALTDEMSSASRVRLHMPRRLPDTTARDALVRVEPADLRQSMYRQVRAAHRRKSLKPVGLPFGVVSLDGKFVSISGTQRRFATVRSEGTDKPFGMVGTINSCLISSAPKVCLDAHAIGSGWGEASVYTDALADLLDAYGSLNLFKLVVYDAGACSQVNARNTRELGLDYLFRVKHGSQPKLYAASARSLGIRTLEQADGICEEHVHGGRERRSVYLQESSVVWPHWTKQRSIVRLLHETLDEQGHVVDSDNRYYVTSLGIDALTPAQWIAVVRGHWAVENNCHHTWDAVLREDDRPWIDADAQGAMVVMLLRRIAYNILTLLREVTRRPTQRRGPAWRDLCRWFYNAMIAATVEQLVGLRKRRPPTEEV